MQSLSDAKLLNLFPTPVMLRHWPENARLNIELRDCILAWRQRSTGENKSNVGGWHSDSGQLEFCGAAGKTLLQQAAALAQEATARVLAQNGTTAPALNFTLHAWANVNETGAFNEIHTHPGSTWSGCYYVDPGEAAGGPGAGAPLQLFDSCQVRANMFLPHLARSNFFVRPETGLMLLFPSYLPHMVLPHQGPRPRISIAFNLRREPYP